VAMNDDVVPLSTRRSRSAQADERSSVWILRTISTKGIVSNGNNNDGECHCLWLRLYQPRGVCATGFDCFYIYRVKEVSTGSATVGVPPSFDLRSS
jgi:hypothetical protein